MEQKIKLLLVEDEQTLAGIIADTLGERGFEVILAYDGESGLKKYHSNRPDVVVTDIMMPCMDGFTLVEHLRKTGNRTPVLFLSARSSAEDVVHGFELGGNDYLRKPFAISELIVRVKALLGKHTGARNHEPRCMSIGSYSFDVERGVLIRDKAELELSARESEILLYLVRNKGEIVASQTLLLNIWGDDSYFNSRSLHVFITRLRNKLASDTSVSIVNARGIGYKLLTD